MTLLYQQSSTEEVLASKEANTFYIHLGDCLDLLKALPDNSIDAIVTDPPYGLGKQPDALEMLKSWLNEESYDPGGGGFMGQKWDSFVPSPIIWKECYRVLKPGGHILAFAGTRTQDLMALSIRIAGFEIRDMLAWVYGSGMPKSMNVSKELDKAAGAQREIVGPGKWQDKSSLGWYGTLGASDSDMGRSQTSPSTEAAAQWEGWGTGIKPSLESLTWASKPKPTFVLDEVLQDTQVLIGALICLSLSSASHVETLLASSLNVLEEECVSAQLVAAVLKKLSLPDVSGKMAMFKSQEVEKIIWNIVVSWNSILVDVCSPESTSTTSTGTKQITALEIFNSLVLKNMQENIIRAQTLQSGQPASANIVVNLLNALSANCNNATSVADLVMCCQELERVFVVADEYNVVVQSANIALQHATTSLGAKVTPNLEPVTLARKPLSQTVIKNVVEHGTGALNIDGCRIPVASGETLTGGAASSTWKATAAEGWDRPWNHNPEKVAAKISRTQDKVAKAEELGRWPANLLHDGSPEVEAMFPDTGKSSGGRIGNATGANFPMVGSTSHVAGDPGKGDSGSAARFFYCAKVSKKDRNEGVTLEAMSAADCVQRKEGSAGLANPRAGAGRTSGNSNHHPTVKPTELMRWLVRLITPPGGVILDPFTGSGSTGKAALWEGFRFIGAEMDERYHQIALERVNTGAILGQGGLIPEDELPEDTGQESEDLSEADPLDWLL